MTAAKMPTLAQLNALEDLVTFCEETEYRNGATLRRARAGIRRLLAGAVRPKATNLPNPTERVTWDQARAVAERCEDAYSFDRYASWPAVAKVCLEMGFTEAEAEEILRSKITRWAADSSRKQYPYGKYPAKVVREYILNDIEHRGALVRQEIAQWAKEGR